MCNIKIICFYGLHPVTKLNLYTITYNFKYLTHIAKHSEPEVYMVIKCNITASSFHHNSGSINSWYTLELRTQKFIY